MSITAKIDEAQIANSKIGAILSSFSEAIGNLDSVSSKYKQVQHLDTELLGNNDSYSKFKSAIHLFADKIGNLDNFTKFKAVNKVVTELISYYDKITKYKFVNKVFNERLGIKDFGRYIFGGTFTKKYHDSPQQQVTSQD